MLLIFNRKIDDRPGCASILKISKYDTDQEEVSMLLFAANGRIYFWCVVDGSTAVPYSMTPNLEASKDSAMI